MTRLLVLGGGRQQLPLISRARERGLEVALVDYLADAPGRALATHPFLADALDADAATQIGSDLSVEGVMTMGTDLAVRTMAEVADRLDLPCYLTPSAARTATDKDLMATALTEAGVPIPRRTVVTPTDELPEMDRGVAKPADSQGQRGVSVFASPATLRSSLEEAWSHSSTNRAVVEAFESGPEITINGWLSDGSVAHLMVNDRVTYNPPPRIGIAFRHVHPSKAATAWLDRIEEITAAIGRAYGMTDGPIYAQAIIGTDGPIVLEAAARVGGGHEEAMMRHLYGWDPAGSLVDLAMGIASRPRVRIADRGAALVNFVMARSGTVDAVGELPDDPAIVESGWYVKAGDQLEGMQNALGRVGYLVVQGPSREEAITAADRLYGGLRLRGADGAELVLDPSPEELNQP